VSPLFELEGIVVRFGALSAVDVEALRVDRGEFVAIVGPNGAGKSTLLTVMAGLRSGFQGSCRLEGREIRQWPRRQLCRAIAFAPQSVDLHFPFTGLEVALMGRAPCTDRLFESSEDLALAGRALEAADATAFSTRDFRTLSGGEKQRVVLASALAQGASTLLLDEPTAFLDPKHQVAVFELLAGRARDGMSSVIATHDLRLASRYCGRIVVLDHGKLAAAGPAGEALRPAVFTRVFEVDPGLWLGA
jgi:iron complex transport system ATP-binding protein